MKNRKLSLCENSILYQYQIIIIVFNSCLLSNKILNDIKIWVSEWLLFNANSAIIYYGENKLIVNEMMIMPALF